MKRFNNFSDEVNEALSMTQRLKRKMQMKRLAPKIARKRKLALRRKASTETLKKRSTKAAMKAVRQSKLLKDRKWDDISPKERERIEGIMKGKYAGLVSKVAKRMLPKQKQKEKERFTKMHSKNKEAV